ncbi:MAG: anti-sigma factor [Chloroflexota bacterium]
MSQPTNLVFECEDILNLIPEYAFGLTDPEQTQWIEVNLSRCPEAVAQLEDYRRLQEEMRTSVPEIEVPVGAGARLMAAAAASVATPVVETATAAAPIPSMTVRPPQSDPHISTSPPVSAPVSATPTKSPRRTVRIAWLAGAAAIAAVLALIITNVYWLTRVADLTQSHDLLATLLSAQKSNNAFVLTSTDALHWVRLADPDPAQNAAAFMMWNAESKTGLLYARSFPNLQPGYLYHVWLTRPNDKVFMGILQVDVNGDGALLFSSPEPINDFLWAWVTAQSPEQSTGAPVGDPIVKGTLNPT